MSIADTNGELVYAIGDVHGCYSHMTGLLAKIAEDADRRARGRRPVLLFLGDYVDRGPDSAKVLHALTWLGRKAGYDLQLIKGNHEFALLEFLNAPDRGEPWLQFGGRETLRSYEVEPPDESPTGLRTARDELLQRMPASHLHLLQQLAPCITIGGYAFVHAGIRPGTPLRRQAEHDLLWIRDEFLRDEGPHEKVIVHGHSWRSADPEVLSHRIGLDTGAYETGVLSAIMLDGEDHLVLQVGRPATDAERLHPGTG